MKRKYIILFILYFISYGLILFNPGIFLDDWTLVGVDKKALCDYLTQPGVIGLKQYFLFLLSFNNILIFRLITFCSFFLSGVFLNLFLKNIKELTEEARFSVVLLFLLFPVNFARIAICTSHYALCTGLFFLGFWLVSKFYSEKKLIYRVLALLAFLVSFSTGSILIFYAVVLFYIAYKEQGGSAVRLRFKIFSNFDFLLLPFFFFIIKSVFFKSNGLYAEYNKIFLKDILLLPINALATFYYSFIIPINDSMKLIGKLGLFLTLLVSFCLFLVIKKCFFVDSVERKEGYFRFIYFGFVVFFLGALPYLLIGRIPSLCDWQSRHQLLIPFGASLVFYYFFRLFCKKLNISPHLRVFFVSVIACLFVVSNFLNFLAYQKDWFKQLALIENFKESSVIKNNTTFIFDDKTPELNACARVYRFYEYNGLMKKAFGNEVRLGFSGISGQDKVSFKDLVSYREYNMGDYKPQEAQYRVVIKYGNYIFSKQNLAKLFYWQLFNAAAMKRNLKNLLVLEYIKI